MKKWIATLTLSSVLLTPALASERSECLKAAWQTLRADLAVCKELKGAEKDNCRSAASKKSKESHAACSAEAKSDEKAPVKNTVKAADSMEKSTEK